MKKRKYLLPVSALLLSLLLSACEFPFPVREASAPQEAEASLSFPSQESEKGKERSETPTPSASETPSGPITDEPAPADPAPEEPPPAETPPIGYYVGDNGDWLELFADGSAVLALGGYPWPTKWDGQYIYNEFETPGELSYADGHLSWGWESGDGYYTYDFDYTPDGKPEDASPRGFFDLTDGEPFFLYREDGMLYGFESAFWGGCSQWCAVSDHSVSALASSTLAPQGNYSYEPSNLLNSNRSNAWVEGADGYGIGEYAVLYHSYSVADAAYGVDFRELCIVNGYARTPETWSANSRVKELLFYFNGVYVDTLLLDDVIEPQYFDLTPYKLHAASGEESVFYFEIVSVYPGEKYEDTAITGIEVDFWTPNH